MAKIKTETIRKPKSRLGFYMTTRYDLQFWFMNPDILVLKASRKSLFEYASALSEQELLTIPEGFKNNILWNIGHILVSQQRLHYGLSVIPLHISRRFIVWFAKGSSASEWKQEPPIPETLSLITSLADQLEKDYEKEIFEQFNPYVTSNGMTLNSIEESIAFNNYHEGLHMGKIQALLKLIRP